MISIQSIHIGQPQTFHDEHGTWRSSIFRTEVEGPVELGERGLAGDQVADTRNHGNPSQAICCHSLEHYRFWNEHHGMSLVPGNVGENWTLEGADEDRIFLDDVYRVGTALVQVSGPRVPCVKQARRVGRADWLKLTLKELRTGFYLRVRTPGIVRAGDSWELAERGRTDASLRALNRCVYHDFDPEVARRFLTVPGLPRYWKDRLTRELEG